MDSLSEKNGLKALREKDREIYSLGISTAGSAEIKMAQGGRRVIATTIDLDGAKFTKELVEEAGLTDHIQVKLEDVKGPLPYPDSSFDFVYARLVLHYLSRNDLQKALKELYRVLKVGGRFFVVVRSNQCVCARGKKPDPETGFISYLFEDGKTYARFFHTKESIEHFLQEAGFRIEYVKAYEEQLCDDYHRKVPSKNIDSLIEVLVQK